MFTNFNEIETAYNLDWKGDVRLGDLFDGDYGSLSNFKFNNLNIPNHQGVYRVILPQSLIQQVEFKIPQDIILRRGKKWYPVVKLQNKIATQNSRCYLDGQRNHDLMVYIGKAEDLRTRLKQYMRFPMVGDVHAGGRAIWQMNCWQDLILQWSTTEEDAEMVEKECLKFIGQGDLNLFPLANWRN